MSSSPGIRFRILRRAAVIGTLMLLLGALFLLVMLVPAHWQIRSIDPTLPTGDQLAALLGLENGPNRIRGFKVAEQSFEGGGFSHNVIALEWPDERLFLIDLGMDEQGAAKFAATLERLMGADPGIFHRDVATHLGEDIARVAGVGFTHLHIDHVQGVDAFCARRGVGAVAFSTAHQAEEHNFHTTEGAALRETSCLDVQVLEGEGLIAVPGFPGLAIVPLGGHTPGSTLFAAAVDGHLWLFSGDTTNSKSDLLEDRGKGLLYSGFLVPEHTGRTAELRAWLRDLDLRPEMTVVVSHDLEAAQREGFPSL